MKNRLQYSSSPYLLQHADNPVDWFEWGDEAFQKAEEENKPIFLSIGYSTCHWCHVMEHESFEDEQVAAFMNEAFINIKVDREERPDIDNLYMSVCQMISQSCGWPLTVIMTPKKEPFYVATYIPREEKYGRPGMMNLVPAIAEAWKSKQSDIQESTGKILEALQQNNKTDREGTMTLEDCHLAFRQLSQSFDSEFAGFGQQPKFPSPHNLIFLLRYASLFNNANASSMAEQTLVAMHNGGMWDQVGFGFHRYSTDRHWFLPHFEKMLYDQAMILWAATEAYQRTGEEKFSRIIQEIIVYLKRDMAHPDGAFYSAEDADSEGEEGKFYVWSFSELEKLLAPEEVQLAVAAFGITREGTYKEEATGEPLGTNILFAARTSQQLAEKTGQSPDEIDRSLKKIKQKLLEARADRVRPGLDDKILSDWNGLLLAALSRAAHVLSSDRILADAIKLADFLQTTMTDDDGRLLHRFRDGTAGIEAFIDDYVFVSHGLLQLFQVNGDPDLLKRAIALMEIAISEFRDEEGGGFYFSSARGEQLLVRNKQIYDGAIPSANSLAVEVLTTLGRLTGDTRYVDLSTELVSAFAGLVRQHPAAYTQFISGVMNIYRGNREIIITAPNAEMAESMLAEISGSYKPGTLLIPVLGEAELKRLQAMIPSLSSFEINSDTALAYVCENFSCRRPVDNANDLKELLL